MSLFSFLKKSEPADLGQLHTDLHSHLLPGIDDGSKNIEESLALIKNFSQLGYKKLITTPHVMQDYYPNTKEVITKLAVELQKAVTEQEIDIEIKASAEYYLDEFLMEMLEKPDDLLFINDKYLLFEMSFMTESPFLREFLFKIRSMGKTPVLAHPERYSYYFYNVDEILDITQRGALIQMNINSIIGYYGKEVKKFSEKLIENNIVNLLGSDCHNMNHMMSMKAGLNSKYLKKALNLTLINREL